MKTIPETHQDLLQAEKKAFLILATIMKDGTPQVTPVWFDTDGDYIRINSAEGRLKDKNMRARPSVAAVIMDPANPYRYVQIRGTVVDVIYEGAAEHIDSLAFKYHGTPRYANHRPGVRRVIYKIAPEHVDAH